MSQEEATLEASTGHTMEVRHGLTLTDAPHLLTRRWENTPK